MSDFVKEIHNMFDHIWDCEIDHPVYQDTVGELMEAVIQAYEKHNLTLSTNLAEVGTDCISRQAAIDTIEDFPHGDVWNVESMEEMVDRIKQLPPIQPVNCSEFPNNSDVVDRQKAKNAICNACGKIDCDEMDTCEKLDIPSEGSKLLQPWEVLAAQSVLSQPEIVRCEECLYRKICSWEKQGAKFCSFAEKREETT